MAVVHAVRSSCNLQTDKPELTDEEVDRLCPFLEWCTLELVRKTLENTFYMTKLEIGYL